ncbi:SPOR and LysM peptidoglycan-binding domain-containing protein [Moraxella catarrhalis]|uniref:SPOR and LysM peptidoglycan-binding domain-containing protein n=1 Tax=Moraxella catarrhalis TaxID=480 RepID=UPI000EAA2D94|nr:LysM peptidoglycan-binding domain-containing protein [Moraxella catarrhalis]MPW78090.1 peptidoglycan-binding protein LysM [Moraxella catarrhalis]MPW96394.1 LysM peptidoglycan-binding domain-containing protein [Moraxella catarrhalis]MPX22064.1 LysM peptidoglycan-binding domain-containing protein [Moraxella catarrhalis]MPX76169.1 LysM peptidoglycan-binding domain-containing protein [Moraxella catarrhalis]RKM24476.1 LysM peptidoglycan-binding domain-containing protein [Moraxella catarrhalis]
MISKQIVLGITLVIGSGVAFFALAKNDTQTTKSVQTPQQIPSDTKVAKPVVQPLTADVATEEKLLAEKQRVREAHTLQMQKQAAALLEEQNNARKQALEKASAEANGRMTNDTQTVSADSAAKSELIAAPTVQTRPEAIEAARKAEEAKKAAEMLKNSEQETKDEKAKTADKPTENKAENKKENKNTQTKAPVKAGTHDVQRGETWQGIANRYGISVAALVEANGVTRNDILRAERRIKIPSASQIARLERDNKAKESASKDGNKKSDNQPQSKTDKKTESKSQSSQTSERYMVQVAISPDKDRVDEVVKKYRDAGYKVTTSNTSRGLRILVGNEKTEEEAKALRTKIAADSRVPSSGAFVHKAQ